MLKHCSVIIDIILETIIEKYDKLENDHRSAKEDILNINNLHLTELSEIKKKSSEEIKILKECLEKQTSEFKSRGKYCYNNIRKCMF